MKEGSKGTPDQKIAHKARAWRRRDKTAISEKSKPAKDAAFQALQELRKTIDDAGES